MKNAIKNLLGNKFSKEEGIKLINEHFKYLSEKEKLLVSSYVYPRRIGDYELPNHIQ
jgi:hypothetical protein